MKSLFLIVSALLLTTTAFAHGISSADTQAMLEGGYLRYIWLGASHMLTGYDHLLFLLGVIFFLTSFNDIVKFVTLFTIGHWLFLNKQGKSPMVLRNGLKPLFSLKQALIFHLQATKLILET